jgi:acyl-CoA thioesterase-2
VTADRPSLLEILTLEPVGPNAYRSVAAFDDARGLYGGQVAAQALRAAALSAPADSIVHSLHGYFLRPGDPKLPVDFTVLADRDGRSYSARRITALQSGEVILNLAASFHRPESGPDVQASPMPAAITPDASRPRIVTRLLDVDVVAEPFEHAPWRVWLQAAGGLPDDVNLHACVLLYLSDMYSGLHRMLAVDEFTSLKTLDHSMWFYRPARADDWLLMDLIPVSVAGGRGMYTGQIFDASGVLVAGLAQESLYRKRSVGHKRTVRYREDGS